MKKTLLSVLVASTTLACGGADPSTMKSETDASQALSAVSAQSSLALAGVTPGSTSGSVDCTGGGTASVSVSGSVSGTGSGSTTQQSDFKGCNTGATTMDGSFKQTATFKISESSFVTDTHMEGTVTFAGAPDGICKFDVTVHASVATGNATSQTITYSGTLCGFDADAVFNPTGASGTGGTTGTGGLSGTGGGL
jgi:hypothetical protein